MKRMFGYGVATVVAGMLVALAGCKPSNAVKHSGVFSDGSRAEQPAAPSASAPLDAATLGSVSGIVKFTGRAPERVKIDMSQDPICSMTAGDNYTEQYVVNNGGLANVFVYVKSGPATAMEFIPPAAPPVVLDQMGCRYVPHVIGVMRGGSVEFRNSDNTMHNVHTMPEVSGNDAVDISQGPKGEPQVKQFQKPEMMIPVRCNNHPWMNAFINVSETPFFAVTDASGHFEIKGLPAGTYTLGAVHEKLGEQTMTVTVAAHKQASGSFSFSMK